MQPNFFPQQLSFIETKKKVLYTVEADLSTRVDQAIHRTQQYLLGTQKADGHWVGELLIDVTVICDYIIYMHWKGEVDFYKQAKFVKHLLRRQQEDGGWNIYPGGPSQITASVKAYFALKLAGLDPDEPEMKRARDTILRLGGIPKVNTYCKLSLALMGQFPWKYLPIIPIEIILLPNWLYFNIYHLSAWTRVMLIPLAIINHFKPTRLLPPEKRLHELYPYGTEQKDFSLPRSEKLFTWRNLFLACDAALKFIDRLPYKPFRSFALKRGEAWILERVGAGSEGLGAIFPSMLNLLIAFKCLGYSDDHPVIIKARKDLDGLEVDDLENDDFRMQPCLSPVWDTAISCVALAESGLPRSHPALVKAADWLLSKEVKRKGDWAVNNSFPYASGWAFEYANEFYPDADDTFKVLLALRLMDSSDNASKEEVMKRALEWARSFQCDDGGYAAFDKNVDKKWLEGMPFADHNAILDPSCSDITGRGLEIMGKMGYSPSDKIVQRMIEYCRKMQEDDGSWFGRWGINYIYGTWQVLRGLKWIGMDMHEDWIVRARDWLESCQNADGGWGESPTSYDDPCLKGQGPTTPSQTAWALMGVLNFDDPMRPSVQRAVHYLTTTQQADGTWREDYITGTGFPRVFYLQYDFYRINWPLIALADYKKLVRQRQLPLDQMDATAA